MTAHAPQLTTHMAAEIAQAPAVFAKAVAQQLRLPDLGDLRAIYTVARGSSDAAANILSYEIMRELGLPMTSLPPSVFSLGQGVRLQEAAVLVILLLFTAPAVCMAPPKSRSFSVSVVLPASGWEMIAKLRRRSISEVYFMDGRKGNRKHPESRSQSVFLPP